TLCAGGTIAGFSAGCPGAGVGCEGGVCGAVAGACGVEGAVWANVAAAERIATRIGKVVFISVDRAQARCRRSVSVSIQPSVRKPDPPWGNVSVALAESCRVEPMAGIVCAHEKGACARIRGGVAGD